MNVMRKLASLRHKVLPNTLFGRSLMIIAMPILILQLVVAFIFFDRHWEATTNKLIYALSGEVHMISTEIAGAGTPAQQQAYITYAFKDLNLVVSVEPLDPLAFVPVKGRLGPFYWFTIGKKLREALGISLPEKFSVRPYPRYGWFEIVVQTAPDQMVRFICSEKRLTGSTSYIFLLWVIGSAAILFGIAMIFMRNQIRPIMRLAIAADKLGKGQDVPDFKPVGAAEVRQAARAFLEMKDRLKRQIEQRTAMLTGVSHDLRTPLTRMRLQLALLKDGPEMESLRQDIDEMDKMLESYLSFARGEGDEAPEMTDMKDVLSRVAANAKRQGYMVHLAVAEKVLLKVRPVAMERAVSNIVFNACKYAETVWVEAAVGGDGMARIIVDDDGPGIAEHEREEVFRPFYRVEKSRNRKTGGMGLGLAIALDVVHNHGGEIQLGDSPHGGLRAEIILPV